MTFPKKIGRLWLGAAILVLLSIFVSGCSGPGLASAYKSYFKVGAAVNSATIDSAEDLLPEFSSLTAENEMKPSVIHPRYKTWHFSAADELANYARENGIGMRGHTFVWHSQTPGWFFASGGGASSRELLLERLYDHISVMADRYGDVVYAWDVVNEAISDNSGEFLRSSPYLDIIGEDYIDLAFTMTREIMPDAKLFYNDYSVLDPAKQDKIYKLLEDMLARGIPVDGIGIQGHWNLWYPSAAALDATIKRFAGLGLDVHITEMDLSMYEHADINTRFREPPADLLALQAEHYAEIFSVLRDNAEHIGSVTFWGIADDKSWLHNFPVSGRKNWPLIFDEEHQPKESYKQIINF